MFNLASSNRSAPSEPSEHPIRVRIISDICELELLVPAWHRLSQRSAWRNPCYEPEFLIPLAKHKSDANLRVFVIERGTGEGAKELLGLVPIIEKPFYRLPFRCGHAWRPEESFDSTPLLDVAHAGLAFQTLLRGLSNDGFRLFSLDTVSASPEFEGLIRDLGGFDEFSIFRRDRFSRAALRPVGDADRYLQDQLSKNRRKKAKRLLKNLGQLGQVRFEHSDDLSILHEWAHAFVDLESSGWKGRQGTAIANNSESLAFFLEMVDRYGDCGGIRFGRLSLDSTPIAMLADICSGDHVSAYKTTFDERFAEHSPGFLLEIQNVRWLHELGCRVCDSCTDPENEMLNRLYADSLRFQNVVFGLDAGMRSWVGTALPWIQKAARFARGLKGRTSLSSDKSPSK